MKSSLDLELSCFLEQLVTADSRPPRENNWEVSVVRFVVSHRCNAFQISNVRFLLPSLRFESDGHHDDFKPNALDPKQRERFMWLVVVMTKPNAKKGGLAMRIRVFVQVRQSFQNNE